MLPRAQINVTPMIDVMLVLLIIFMIVTPIIESRVALPRSDSRGCATGGAGRGRPRDRPKRDLFPFYHWGPSAARECATCDWCGCLA